MNWTSLELKKILIRKFQCQAPQQRPIWIIPPPYHKGKPPSWQSAVFTCFSELIKHAFSTAMHGTRPVEASLLNLLVCMEFAGLWLQILKPIIQIAATVTGRASVSRTRGRSVSEIHNKMFPAVLQSYLSAPFQDRVRCPWVGVLKSVMCEITLS